jgi:MoaA/NifB/PqqE/SkfB family radical SAM enzyme
MDINRIEFIVTYRCSGQCKHCSLGDKLNYADGFNCISARRAAAIVEEISQIFSVASVMTFGGEPMLYADTVYTIHETAERYGIGTRQLITNGHFTNVDEQRKQAAKSLKQAGVNNLLLSVDAFHQETIPIEGVYAFARYAKASGVPNIRLQPAWVVDEHNDNPFNKKTKEILRRFEDLDIAVAKGNNIFMAGNAVTHLAQYYDKPTLDMADSCGSMPYTEPLTGITSLSIVPNGNVMICGFVIGNIYRQSMEEIVSQYDPYQNEWMRAIIVGGASALLDLSRQKGLAVNTSLCYSVCDLCHRINSSLSI